MYFSNSDLQIDYLTQALLLDRKKLILDVGCCDCIHFSKFENLGFNIFGIDVNPKIVHKNIFKCDIFKFNTESKFNAIYHLALQLGNDYDNFELLLIKYFNLLEVNGLLVIDFMNYHSYIEGEIFNKTFNNSLKIYSRTDNLFKCEMKDIQSLSHSQFLFWKIFTLKEFKFLCNRSSA